MQKWFFIGLVGLALLLFQPLCAQKEGTVWYFGNHAGLDFKDQYPKPLTNGQINSSEGVSAISDKNGTLLFYTDGQTVFTSSHQTMTNGQGLFGNNSATQSSIIVPWPNHPEQFYIFTVGKVGTTANPGKGLYYSIVDMNSNRVDPNNLNVQLLETCTEKITAIRHNNGVDWWILAHQINTSVFHEFLLSDALLQQDPQINGLKHQVDINNPGDKGAAGYLKGSPNGDFVALAIEGFKRFEVFKFDNKNGKLLLNPKSIELSAEAAYGVEFSPTGKYLYGTNRQDGIIYRWKLDDFSKQAVNNSREYIFSDPALTCGALQLAPNGKIYVAFDNKPYLGVINAPDLDSCGFVVKGASLFDYDSKFKGISGFGLPNFPSVYVKNEIYYSNACVNDTTLMYLSSNDLVDFIRAWYINGEVLIGDPLTKQVKYAFKKPGEYLIKMEGLKDGNSIPLERTIRIHPLPVLAIKDTTYLCAGQPFDLHEGNYAFYGITNEAGAYSDSVRSIDQPGLYRVTATNYEGCTHEVSTRAIGISPPEIDTIAVSPAVCTGAENGSIRISMKGVLADYHFKWSDEPANTNYRGSLKPGKYPVTISSIITGCEIDTTISVELSKLLVKINRLPPDASTVCPGTEITLTATGAGAETFVWDHEPGVRQNSVIVNPDTTTTFKVTGSGREGTCFGTDSIKIQVFPDNKLELGPDRTACAGETVVLRKKDIDPRSVYDVWNWSNLATTDSLLISYSISNLYLRVQDKNGCWYHDDINIVFNPAVKVKIVSSTPVDSAVCAGLEITLTATGAESYVWEHDPDLLENPIIAKLDRDTVFKVTGSDREGQCFGSDAIQIKVFPDNSVDLGPDSTTCAGGTIVLYGKDYAPEPMYKEWIWNPGGKTDSITLTNSIPNLILSVKDNNGCSYKDSINITFNQAPVISEVVKKDITCFGAGNGILEIKVDGDPLLNQYSIYPEDSWSDKKIYTNLQSGNYVVKVKTKSGCMSPAYPVAITEPERLDTVIKSISPSCPECTDGEIRISVTGGTPPYSFDWEGFNFHDAVFSHIGADTYSITITDANKCLFKIDYPLIASKLIIPNAFSPNGGIKNEKWIIKILDNRQDCLVQVYDRSGKVVFYNAGVYERWDGTYLNQGKELPAGTYFYLIRVDTTDENKPPQRGTVTILR